MTIEELIEKIDRIRELRDKKINHPLSEDERMELIILEGTEVIEEAYEN